MATNLHSVANATEEAFLYDLSIVPQWREVFNRILDDEVKPPESGTILEAGCGTGDYALGLAVGLGSKGTVLGVDPSEARLNLARAKAALKRVDNCSFGTGSVGATGVPAKQFDLVVGDLTRLSSGEIRRAIEELRRAAKPAASVALLGTTRGSFDEFYSIYWEALCEEGLVEHSPMLEALVTARPTVGEIEELAREAGLRRVRSVTRKHRLDYADGATFLSSPLIANYFLPDWLALLRGKLEHARVLRALARVIDRARDGIDFDVSIRATVVLGIR